MGLGPVLCSTAILRRQKLALNDIDLWELNEAFAAQVLGCVAAWQDDKFCREVLHLDGPAGVLDHDKLNIDGGAIGLGHPVGAGGQSGGAASRQRDETAWPQTRHRHRMYRWRPGRRHVDRDGVGAPHDTESLGYARSAQFGTWAPHRAGGRESFVPLAALEA